MARAAKSGKRPGTAAVPPTPVSRRILAVDAARGVAVALMVGYHFCFDLNYFKIATFDFQHSPFWLAARATIVTLFLLLVGISLHLATENGLRARPYLRRLGLLAFCAVLVSVSSYAMFPASGIFFGILHFIALASLLGLFFTRLYKANLVIGLACIAAGLSFQHVAFDSAWASWIGFVTHKPVTEDYVPIFPWFGVVLLGLFLGKAMTSGNGVRKISGAGSRMLAFSGRHSLAIYMLHQPLLMGLLYLLSRLFA